MALSIKDRGIIDALIREGVTRTTDRLEKMTGVKWGIMSSSVNEAMPVQLLRSNQQHQDDCLGAHFHASSLVPLEFLITFSTKSANTLASAILQPFRERMQDGQSPIAITIGEVSNFLAQSVLAVVADRFNVMIITKPPEILLGRKVDLISKALSNYDGREDMIMISQVDVYSEKLSVECSLIVIVNAAMVARLIQSAST
jgi:hypothetical protein